jgi:hypothetical protein
MDIQAKFKISKSNLRYSILEIVVIRNKFIKISSTYTFDKFIVLKIVYKINKYIYIYIYIYLVKSILKNICFSTFEKIFVKKIIIILLNY